MGDSGYSVVLDASSIRRRLMAPEEPATATATNGEAEEATTAPDDVSEANDRPAPRSAPNEGEYRMPMFLNGRLASVRRAPEEIGASPLPTGMPDRLPKTAGPDARRRRDELLERRDDPVVRFVEIVASITQDNPETLLRGNRDARPLGPDAGSSLGGDGATQRPGPHVGFGEGIVKNETKNEEEEDAGAEWEEEDDRGEEEQRLLRRPGPAARPKSPEPADPRDAWSKFLGARSASEGTASRDDERAGSTATTSGVAQKRRLDAFLGRTDRDEASARSEERASKRRREASSDLSRVHTMVLGALSFVVDRLRPKMKFPRSVKGLDLVLSDLTYAETARMCGHQIQIESGNNPLMHQGKIREVTAYHMGSFARAMSDLLSEVAYDPRRGGFVERTRASR